MITVLKLDRLAVLKIDAEGYDPAVLRGAKETLSHKLVDLLQFECVLLVVLCPRLFFRVVYG